jgi:hypothetical protein
VDSSFVTLAVTIRRRSIRTIAYRKQSEQEERQEIMTQNTHVSEPDMKTDRVSTSLRHKCPPGPRENWLFGSASSIQRDPLGLNKSMLERYGNVVAIRFLIWPT